MNRNAVDRCETLVLDLERAIKLYKTDFRIKSSRNQLKVSYIFVTTFIRQNKIEYGNKNSGNQ